VFEAFSGAEEHVGPEPVRETIMPKSSRSLTNATALQALDDALEALEHVEHALDVLVSMLSAHDEADISTEDDRSRVPRPV